MSIDTKLKLLRTSVRNNSKTIIDNIVTTYVKRNTTSSKHPKDVCIFCSRINTLTKEHVLPKWTFEKCTEKYFITDINGKKQTYNRTTVPVCANCNNNLLSSLEDYVVEIFTVIDLKKQRFSNTQLQNIIRWLETIEYKFQVLEVRRKFISDSTGNYIPYLADFPISVLRKEVNYSPSKVITEIRTSQKRLTIKSKDGSINSLVIFKTKNKAFYFFHNMNEFIFIELPQFRIAIFYFYKKNFIGNLDAYKEAMAIITRVYNS